MPVSIPFPSHLFSTSSTIYHPSSHTHTPSLPSFSLLSFLHSSLRHLPSHPFSTFPPSCTSHLQPYINPSLFYLSFVYPHTIHQPPSTSSLHSLLRHSSSIPPPFSIQPPLSFPLSLLSHSSIPRFLISYCPLHFSPPNLPFSFSHTHIHISTRHTTHPLPPPCSTSKHPHFRPHSPTPPVHHHHQCKATLCMLVPRKKYCVYEHIRAAFISKILTITTTTISNIHSLCNVQNINNEEVCTRRVIRL